MEGLIEEFSPFEEVARIIATHRHEPPAELLPRLAHAVAGAAGERLGLLRAVFFEVTAASDDAIFGMRGAFGSTLGLLAGYMQEQMADGRVPPMNPLLAVQAFIGPVFFHLMTRPALERIAPIDMPVQVAVDQLVSVTVRGLEPRAA
jgi:hypothetical protein